MLSYMLMLSASSFSYHATLVVYNIYIYSNFILFCGLLSKQQNRQQSCNEMETNGRAKWTGEHWTTVVPISLFQRTAALQMYLSSVFTLSLKEMIKRDKINIQYKKKFIANLCELPIQNGIHLRTTLSINSILLKSEENKMVINELLGSI